MLLKIAPYYGEFKHPYRPGIRSWFRQNILTITLQTFTYLVISRSSRYCNTTTLRTHFFRYTNKKQRRKCAVQLLLFPSLPLLHLHPIPAHNSKYSQSVRNVGVHIYRLRKRISIRFISHLIRFQVPEISLRYMQ